MRSDISSALVETIVKTLEEQPASTDQYCRLLALLDIKPSAMLEIEQYLVNDARAIHQWQNYHMWFMLAKKGYVSEVLRAAAKNRITKSLFSAEIPAIFIYLHCIQGNEALKALIPSFSADWPYQHQRHFLLAIKDLPAEELKTLVPHLKRKITRTTQRATPYLNQEGIPLAEKEPLKISEMYDNISAYD